MSMARPLSAPEAEAFRLARLVAAEWQPYLMHALFAVSPVAAEGLGTFAVDAWWRLYMDPARLVGESRWETPQTAGVLLHEVGHLLRDHAGRAGHLPSPVHRLAWNLAGDAEINDDLIAAAVPLPGGPVTPEALGCPDGELAETYYASLSVLPNLPDDGGAGCGSGSGFPAAPGELPAGVDAGAGAGAALDAAEADLVRRRVAQAVKDATSGAGRGSVPAGIDRWASGVLAPPVIGWARLLRSAIRRGLADQAGRIDYTYRRPSRRQVPGIVRPAMRAPRVRVSVVVDTSGSMSQADLDAAMSEIGGVLRSAGVDREGLRLVCCDAAAIRSVKVRSLGTVRLVGGGGTDMRVGIEAAEAERPGPDVVIVLTDGDTPWPDHPGRAGLVCGIIARRPPADGSTPAWARTVHIPTGIAA